MAVIKPFRAQRYGHARVSRLEEVLSPPLEALTTEEQLRLHLRNPLNAVRLERGQDQPDDDAVENRHVRSGDFWRGWRDQGVLRRDSVPAFYLLEETHAQGVRRGIFAAVQLEDADSGRIRPFQEARPEVVAERLALLRSVQADTCPILAMYEDPHQMVAERFFDLTEEALPLAEFTDEAGTRRRLWYVNDPEAVADIQEELAESPLVIADGAERYAAALAYRDEKRAQTPNWTGDEAWNYALMLLVDVEDPGLVVAPAHVLVRPERMDANFAAKLDQAFIVGEKGLASELPSSEELEEGLYDLSEAAERRTRFGMLMAGKPQFFILTMHEGVPVPGKRSEAWKRLDATRLQTVVLERLLGMSEADRADGAKLALSPDARDVVMGLGSGRYPLAFFLNPVPARQIWDVARAGELLQAGVVEVTPKVPAGIVFNPLEGML